MSNEILQAVYDKACAAIIQQGKPAIITKWERSICQYRTPDGLKCAVGHLVSDEQIQKFQALQNNMAAGEFSEDMIAELLPGITEDDGRDFLMHLQQSHDDCSDSMDFVADFKERAVSLALQWGLVPIA
jgi:hypothetical protein